MKATVKALTLAAVALLMSASLTACNTIEGMGKDIKKAGQSIEGAADRSK